MKTNINTNIGGNGYHKANEDQNELNFWWKWLK